MLIAKGRVLFLAFALLLAPRAPAAVYYVERNNGSDKADGLTPSTAWSSLGRITAQPLSAGDYVLLRRGDIWTEPLVLTSSGLPYAPITIGAYGAGAPPLIDAGTQQAGAVDLVSFASVSNVVLRGIEIRNATRNGIDVYRSAGILIRDVKVSASRQAGVLSWNSVGVSMEDSEISHNGLDTSADYDGIRIDGTGELNGFLIRNCRIHDNIGGEDWKSSNGIFLGHTGANPPTLRGVIISGNEIYSNGNPNQNQAGRGISGTLQGEVTVTGNYVYRNASAGIYLGDHGMNVDLTYTNNTFYNNALRQFGGITAGHARALRNYVVVDDPNMSASGAEVGGEGSWELTNNAFYYPASTTDTYRAFLRNDAAPPQILKSDWNLFYTAGPRRWKLANGIPMSFQAWQADGFDPHSVNPN